MKGIYVTIIILAVIIVAMIISAFFYLDLQRRQTFLYALYQDDVLIGYEKVDKYILENSLIYKSISELPRDIFSRKIVRKMTFDARGKKLVDYTKDVEGNGADYTEYILSGPEKISFMSTGYANFSYLDSIPRYGNDLIFEKQAIVTYPPLIRRYNFKNRDEQFVNALAPISTFLPPVRNIASITSIGRSTIEIEDRKINCERLIFELQNGDLISVWTSRRFHNILMVDIPKLRFKAVFCTYKKDIPSEEYKRKSELYTQKEVIFNNEDISLSGTVSVPSSSQGPYPAIMLIWDSGPMDRNNIGIFTDLAHALAEAGYCVFRFDKRGIGRSKGLFSAYAQPEEISDLKCGIEFLGSLPEVDKSRIAVLGYSEGGFYASYLAGSYENVRACVILSALSSFNPLKDNCDKLRKFIKGAVPNDIGYLNGAVESLTQSRNMVMGKDDWVNVLGKKVFTKKINLENTYSVLDAVKKVKVPVLILHGRKDDLNLAEEVREIGESLASAGNDNFTSIYYGRLDHFFGTLVNKPPIREYIEVDIEVLTTITNWLRMNLPPSSAYQKNDSTFPSKDIESGASQLSEPASDKPAPDSSSSTKIKEMEDGSISIEFIKVPLKN